MSSNSRSQSQTMVNQGLFDQEQDQMGFFTNFPPNLSCLPLGLGFNIAEADDHAPLSSVAAANHNLTETLFSSTTQKHREEDLASDFGGPQLLSLQRSTANFSWAWGEEKESCLGGKKTGTVDDINHLGVSAMKMKRIKSRRKVREPRFCFKTMTDVDVLDDGYKWRKYGQKVVKNTHHPRSYYRCTQNNCRVKKRVERLAEDPRMVITTYEGRHAHSPSHDLDDSQTPHSHLITNFFW